MPIHSEELRDLVKELGGRAEIEKLARSSDETIRETAEEALEMLELDRREWEAAQHQQAASSSVDDDGGDDDQYGDDFEEEEV